MNNLHTQTLLNSWINLKAVEKTRCYLDHPYIEMIAVVDELSAYLEPFTENQKKTFASYTPDFHLNNLHQGLKDWRNIMEGYDRLVADKFLDYGRRGLFESHCEVSYWNFKRQLFDKINLAYTLLIEYDLFYAPKAQCL